MEHGPAHGSGRSLSVLFVSTRDVGGRTTGRIVVLRTHLEALAELGHRVVLAVVAPQPPAESAWSQRFPTSHVPAPSLLSIARSTIAALATRRSTLNEALFVDRRVQRRIADLVREHRPDVVVVDSLRMSRIAERLQPSVPTIVDLDDLLSLRYERLGREGVQDPVSVLGFAAGFVPRPLRGLVARGAVHLLGWEGRRATERERYLAESMAAVSLVSQHEVDVLRQQVAGDIRWLPPAVSVPAHPVVPGDGLVFLGGLDYQPNMQALRFYRDEVLPHLDATDPRYLLHVVGHVPDDARRELTAPGIILHGFVPDLHAALSRRVLVAPLLSAGGVKLKVLDGLAYGLPVAGTTGAFEGLGLPDWLGERGDDGRRLAGAVERLIADPRRCADLGRAGRAFVEEHFSQRAAVRRWHELLTDVEPGSAHTSRPGH